MRRLAAALGLVAAAAAPVAAAPGAPACASYATGRWVTVAPPPFPAGPRQVVDYAVAPNDPDRMFVTNGYGVMATADAGCHWSASLPQLDVPVLGATPKVMKLGMSAVDPDTVYAALGSDSASRPSVLKTSDGGKTWNPADRGLEALQGRPLQLVVGADDPDIAFVVVEGNSVAQGDTSAEVARALYGTDDGGRSWTERTASPLLVAGADQQVGPVRVAGNGSFEGVATDPRDSRVVWLYGGFGLYASRDGARTSQRVVPGDEASGGGPIGAVDVFHTASSSRVLAFGSIRSFAFASFDGGGTFARVPTPGVVRSAATGRRYAELVIATDTRVFYQDGFGQAAQITPSGPSLADVRVAYGATPVFFGKTAVDLLRWTAAPDPKGPHGGPPVPVVNDPNEVVVPRLPPLPASTLTGPATVSGRAGERVAAPYALDLPGVQRVDVYFLVDVSDSMKDEINGLRSALAGIVSDLVSSNVDAWFGVGRYNTYDFEPYFRVVPVQAPGRALEDALETQLNASAGGEQKSQLEAVYQSVTGAGGSGDGPPGPLGGAGGSYYVAPGQQAGFRPSAPVKIVLNATDEPFYESAPSPAYDKVVAALRAHHVLQLGLALENDDVLPRLGAGPEEGLRRLALGSGAIAPPEGVDCDGDGAQDIAPGQPLVCLLPSARSHEATLLANAIVNLVKSLPNRGSVDFAVSPSSAGAPAATVGPRASFDVEFKDNVRRAVEVTYTCPTAADPADYTYDVRATTGGGPLAAATTVLHCEPLAAPLGRPPAPPLPGAVAAPAQAPSGHGNANPNVNPNSQANPQAQPNAGAATEEEKQFQLQVAEEDIRDDGELAMSRREVPPAAWYAGAFALSAVAAAGLRRRAAPRTAPAQAGVT